MQHRLMIKIIVGTLVFFGAAAAAYALAQYNAESQGVSGVALVDTDLLTDEVGEPIAVSLEPILNQEADDSAALPDAIANAVIAKHAQFINAPTDSISVERSSRQTWSDGCLGLGGPAEACLFALTEGWQVTVVDSTGEATTYRTDLSADSIRREPKNGEPVPLEEASPLSTDG